MSEEVGKRVWAVGDCRIPGWSHGPEPEMQSHEGLSFLNASDRDAELELEVFFEDRDPAGPYDLTVPARRTKHVRLNELRDPEPVPAATDMALLIRSSVPVVAQQTRLDSRQAENALISVIPYASD